MPVQYEYDDLRKRAVINVTEPFDIREVLACVMQHRAGRGSHGLFFDVRGMVTLPSMDEVGEIARTLDSLPGEPACGPLAIIARDPVMYSRACAYAVVGKTPAQIRVVRYWDEAEEWMNGLIKGEQSKAPDGQRPTLQWIDLTSGVAHIAVRPTISDFGTFLDGVERLIARPDWRPGTPVIEDIRDCFWVPPPSSMAEWRGYVAARQALLTGCRWAVVRRGGRPMIVSLLNAAADDAAPVGVLFKHFTNMQEAHLWVKPPGTLTP